MRGSATTASKAAEIIKEMALSEAALEQLYKFALAAVPRSKISIENTRGESIRFSVKDEPRRLHYRRHPRARIPLAKCCVIVEAVGDLIGSNKIGFGVERVQVDIEVGAQPQQHRDTPPPERDNSPDAKDLIEMESFPPTPLVSDTAADAEGKWRSRALLLWWVVSWFILVGGILFAIGQLLWAVLA